jgi:predicted DNA-binding transcriptional regulator AlpA
MSRRTVDQTHQEAAPFVGSNEFDHLWTDSWVAKLVNVSRATLRRWRKQSRGPPYMKLGPEKGAAVRYSPADVEAWLTARRSARERTEL